MLTYFLNIILKSPNMIKKLILLTIDSFTLFFSIIIVYIILLNEQLNINDFINFFIVSYIFFFFSLILFGFYKVLFRYSSLFINKSLVKSLLFYLVLMILWQQIFNTNFMSINLMISQISLLFIFMNLSRWVFCKLINYNASGSFHNKSNSPILIYGCGMAGSQLSINLQYIRNVSVIAFLDDDTSLKGRKLNNLKIYHTSQLDILIKKYGNFDVVLAIPSLNQGQRSKILQKLLKYNLNLRMLPSIEDIISRKSKLLDIKEIRIEDLLSRQPIEPNKNLLKKTVFNKTVVITGSGGSIGSELARQIITQKPNTLLLVEQNEYALFKIYEELKKIIYQDKMLDIKLVPILTSILNYKVVSRIFLNYKPDTLFHAAAHKHVSLVEKNYFEGFINNVFGTLNLAKISINNNLSNFVLISTDKAVKPINMMGASKRVSELILQGLSQKKHNTKFAIVRFGNVLGSSGSVVPIFREQIKKGEPIEVRDERVTRFFMTISEAAELVIQASGMGSKASIYYLDMGSPVKILDLAKKMILLSGSKVKSYDNEGIAIEFSGLKPGEKLHEELSVGNKIKKTRHPRIIEALEESVDWKNLEDQLNILEKKINNYKIKDLKTFFKNIDMEYKPKI